MHKHYEYTSVFSEHLDKYIQIHRDAGFEYDNPAYWLYRFDQYCTALNVGDAVLNSVC